MFVIIGSLVITGFIWGVAAQLIVENKGYSENWFWWGFFFNFIAVLVALSKPQVTEGSSSGDYSFLRNAAEHTTPKFSSTYTPIGLQSANEMIAEAGKWKCGYCSRWNPGYTGTCACGKTKEDTIKKEEDLNKYLEETEKVEKIAEQKKIIESASVNQDNTSDNKIEQILKLKDMLDSGLITMEEFEKLKKSIINQ